MKLKKRFGSITKNMQDRRPLVVDVNVVISALMHKGDSLEVFLQNFVKEKFDFISPYFLLIELSKYTEKIMKKTKLSSEELLEMTNFVMNQIILIRDIEFSDKVEEAKEILKEHYKDSPYLALALARNCNLFSGDKTLKSLYPERIKNPKEILYKLDNY